MNRSLPTLALLALAFALTAPSAARAQEISPPVTHRALGIGVGDSGFVNGLTLKLRMGPSAALQAFGGFGGYGLGAAADVVLNLGTWVNVPVGRLDWGLGAGGGLSLWAYGGEGYMLIPVCGIFHVVWSFRRWVPLELTADLRPTYILGFNGLAGYVPFAITGGGAARWYF